MKAVLQRVRHAAVTADGQPAGQIGAGMLVLLGVVRTDGMAEALLLARKIAALRFFCDEAGKLNRSALDVGADALVVSNFTLCADLRRGNRPSFDPAMPPPTAEWLYLQFCDALRQAGVHRVQTGVFGADMQIDLCADGPVTLELDTDLWQKTPGK